MRVTLQVIAGPCGSRKTWLRPAQSVVLGRTDWADVSLPEDDRMSGRHFAVECGPDVCRLRDLGSANGTFVNGRSVSEAVLRDGDEILAGQTRFRVSVEGEARSVPSPADERGAASASRATATDRQHAPERLSFPIVSSAPGASEMPLVPAAGDGGGPSVAGAAAALEPQGQVPEELLALANQTPFPAATTLWEDAEGAARLTVIVKATFAITPGRARAAEKQAPVFTADKHKGDDPTAPVLFESDMSPFKPRADVVLVGRAHAPFGRPVAELDVALRVGLLEKKVRVFGDRKWRFGMVSRMSAPEPFVTMELAYDRAFGGIDAAAAQYCKENLAGRGFIGAWTRESIDGKALPNLEDPDNLIDSWRTHPKPAGFGFYGRGWMPRLAYAGTYDEKYRKERAPAPPADFSYAFFNGAHPDLQVEGYLQGDELVELEHLAPQRRAQFQLPGIRPLITLRRRASSNTGRSPLPDQRKSPPCTDQSAHALLDTLVLVPDEMIFYEVFRGVFPLPGLETIDVARIRITL